MRNAECGILEDRGIGIRNVELKTEDRNQRTEDKRQKSDNRKQKPEDRRQRLLNSELGMRNLEGSRKRHRAKSIE